jgi:anaerobic ribonucleoside-triphosphate reductase activating protein
LAHPFVGPEISVANVLDRVLAHLSEQRLDGATFSGGEPMQQAHELAALLEQLKTAAPEISIGMFSGYSLAELDSGRFRTRGGGNEWIGLWRSIQSHVDFGVMGRYNHRQPSTDPLCTSKNQKLHLFTARHSEGDFGEQAVEVTISADGLTHITGFPTLGVPA